MQLPSKYYHSHFQELRSVLLEQYHAFFETGHFEFLSSFGNLSEDAQCLYLRMMNRKGRFFFKSRLQYEEILNPLDGFQELELQGLIEKVQAPMWEELLSFLPKKELLSLARERNLPVLKSWGKKDLENSLVEIGFFESDLFNEIVVQSKLDELSYLLFLYFGRIQENLSLYTLRDLGIRKVREGKKSTKARFVSKDEALSQFFYSRVISGHMSDISFDRWPVPFNAQTEEMREHLLVTLAEEKKKEGNFQEALEILSHTRRHPGREKYIRLLHQTGDHIKSKKILEEILDNPVSDLEFLFAEDFYSRKFGGKRISVLTETLRNSKRVQIDESFFRRPEAGVIEWLKSEGKSAYHIENYLWNALFGLLFWEELYESDKTSLFNEFDRRPGDLSEKTFHLIHADEIEHKLELLADKSNAIKLLLERANEKKDVQNGIFGRHESLPELLELLITFADHKSLADVLRYMCKDFNNRSTGFPDIISLEDGIIKFYEVKAPGDSLKNQQLLQMIALTKAGFPVEVLQVDYIYNPHQLYVVVDLETTGGHLPYHRITEIGAVKMRNGEVIEAFQTLINPERYISREIVALTGITNEMVKDAPKFSEVAEAFQLFTKDCIFVAHNVSFDYNFLQSEYQRLDQKFVRPYICTKAGMRKHYPGLSSYGLKKLSDHFNITLTNHHRALSDAEAAAGLLKLINVKRSGVF